MGSDGKATEQGASKADIVAIQAEPVAAADGGRDFAFWEFDASARGRRC
jgi:hypothetical protein